MVLFTLLSCNKANLNNGNKIDLEINNNFSIYDLFSEIEITPLENNDSVIVDYLITKTLFYKDYIYILNPRINTIFIFDTDGRFINKLENGDGPDKFTTVLDYNINRYTGNLEVLAPFQILIYDSNGNNYLGRIRLKMNHMPDCFINVDSSRDALFCQYTDKKILFYDRNENTIVDSLYEMPQYIYDGLLGYNATPFLERNDSIFFLQGYNGDLFTITYNKGKGRMNLYSRWNFGKESFSYKKLKPNQNLTKSINDCKMFSKEQPLGFFSFFENSKYQFISFWYDSEPTNLIFNKLNKQSTIIRNFKENLRFGKTHIDENSCYLVVPANKLHLVVDKNILTSTSINKLRLLNEDSNPVIVKYKFKK